MTPVGNGKAKKEFERGHIGCAKSLVEFNGRPAGGISRAALEENRYAQENEQSSLPQTWNGRCTETRQYLPAAGPAAFGELSTRNQAHGKQASEQRAHAWIRGLDLARHRCLCNPSYLLPSLSHNCQRSMLLEPIWSGSTTEYRLRSWKSPLALLSVRSRAR